MDDGVADILESCLDRLAAGASVDECLAVYPAQRGALEPALRAAAGLMQLPRPAMPAHTRATLEAQMLARAAARRAAPPARQPWWRLGPSAILAGALRALGYGGPLSAPWLRIAATAVAVVLALLLGAGAYAAARTIVTVFLPAPTPTPMPTAAPAPQTFAIEGVVERIDQEAWVVGGATIAIDAQTTIAGVPALGALARISGVTNADGSRLARDVRVDSAPTPQPATPTVAPTPTPNPTAVPTPFVFPTITPAPAAPPVVAPPADNGNGNGDDKQCQGQQKGRDEKKCDPKPKPQPKDDKKDDKKKDDKKPKK